MSSELGALRSVPTGTAPAPPGTPVVASVPARFRSSHSRPAGTPAGIRGHTAFPGARASGPWPVPSTRHVPLCCTGAPQTHPPPNSSLTGSYFRLPSPVSPGRRKDAVWGAQPSPSCLVSPRAARLEVPTAQRQPAPCSRGPPGTHASLGPRLCLHDAALVRGSRRKVRPAVLPRPLGREHCGVTETGHRRPLPGWARGSPTAGGRARQGPRPGGSHRSARHPCGRDSGWTVFLGCCVHRVPCPPFLEETRGSPP